MSQPDNPTPEQLKIRERNFGIIQDFNNKKANSHATIFVASMFGLFTILSLAQRISKLFSNPIYDYTILGFSVASYVLIWFFGLYELLNFFYYSTTAFLAEDRLVVGLETELATVYRKEGKGLPKRFALFKVPEKPQGFVRKNNEQISIVVYIAIGLLPLIAFLIWFFLS